MLLTAVSSRCFSSRSRCCDARCCRDSLRTTRNSRAAITRTKSPATMTRKTDLLLPVGQRRRHRRRRDDHDGKVRQGAGRNQPVAAVHRTGQPGGAVLLVEQRLLMRRPGLEIAADHLLDMRMARQQRAVAMVHRNRRILSKRHRLEEFREAGGLDASADHPQEFAVWPGQLARKHGGPGAGDAAVDRFDQQRRGFGVRLEGLEKSPVGDVDGPRRPAGGGVDHHAVRIEQIDAADIGKCVDLGLEHLVNVRARTSVACTARGFRCRRSARRWRRPAGSRRNPAVAGRNDGPATARCFRVRGRCCSARVRENCRP